MGLSLSVTEGLLLRELRRAVADMAAAGVGPVSVTAIVTFGDGSTTPVSVPYPQAQAVRKAPAGLRDTRKALYELLLTLDQPCKSECLAGKLGRDWNACFRRSLKALCDAGLVARRPGRTYEVAGRQPRQLSLFPADD